MNPAAPGTLIKREVRHGSAPIAGIASIGDTCLLTVSAPSMVDIIGVDSRLFSALAGAGISVYFVCQSSSETGITFGVSNADAEAARATVDEEFAAEIRLHFESMLRFYGMENGFRISRKTLLAYFRGRGFPGELRASVSYLDSMDAFETLMKRAAEGPAERYWQMLAQDPSMERRLKPDH